MKALGFTLRKLAIAFMVALLCLVPVVRLAHSETPKLDPPSPNTSIRFSSLSLEQGLSQSVVTVTYQDSLGYLWFGTHDGLNRYDGYNFVIYRPDPDDPTSISDRMISSIIEDPQGGLWIGTVLGGLNRYDRGTDQFTHLAHNPVDPDGLSGSSVRVLEFDPHGRLWIGTDGGLDIFDPQQGIFITHNLYDSQDSTGLAHYGINDILQDQAGVMWVASEGGVSYYDPSNDLFNHITHDPGDPDSLVSNRITCIYEDRDGFLWFGTPVGLDRMNPQEQRFEHFTADSRTPESLSNSVVNDILEDRFGYLWVGTGDGLNLLDPDKGSFTVYRSRSDDPTSISNSTILSLVEDREGILWIGTAGGGVNKLDHGRNKFPLLQYDPDAPKNISSFGLLEDHTGKLWFTITGEGVLSLDRTTGEYILYRHDPAAPDDSLLDDFVQSISESHDGTIWIGGQHGLNSLDPNTGHITQYTYDEVNPDSPHSLGGQIVGFTMEDSQGILWIAMPTGLDSFNPETGIFTHYRSDRTDPASLSNPDVAYIYESAEGEIWLGMYEGGLSMLDRESGKFTHYRHNPINPASISSDAVYMIMQDQTGTMWLGTNEGLNKFDPESGKAIHYTVKDGLPNDVVYAIVEDGQGYFWLSTNFGLSRFDPRTGNTQNYDYDDGLQSNEFNPFAFAKTRSGEIIFSGIDGTNIFLPEMIQNNEYVPPVVLTRLTQGGEPLNFQPGASSKQVVTLHWPYNYFEFEFSALSYSNPAENQYAYQLENFDQDWIDSGSYHFGRYTNLPNGTYTLFIKGSNNDGVWNEAGTKLNVTVVPPFWQTWWFRISAVLLVGAAVFAIYRLRVHNIESYNRDLKSQVDERTKEIETLFEQTKELAIVEERNRLARDLHDSAKQKAFAALAQLGAVRSMIPRDPASAITHLNEVEDLVYEVIQELTFLIQEMYPLALKEKGLITVLREYIYEWENRNDIRVNLVVDHERQLPLEIEQAFYRITQESLANIARHSHASQVSIELNYNGEAVEMLLIDNGIGFNPAQKPAGVGLRTMQERALMIGGCLEIHSTPGEGARIRVTAPVRQMDNSNPDDFNGVLNGSSNHNPDR